MSTNGSSTRRWLVCISREHGAVSGGPRPGPPDAAPKACWGARAASSTLELVELAARTDLETVILVETNEQVAATSEDEIREAISALVR